MKSLSSTLARTLWLNKWTSIRSCSTYKHLKLSTEEKGIAVLSLDKKPVNSFNLEFLTEFKNALQSAEKDRAIKGLVLTSSVPRVFTAGLDLTELYKPNDQRLETFLRTLQDVFLTLYGTRLPTVAAITGSASAAGCIFALSCDSRVMATGKHTLSLNEVQLGVVVSFWVRQVFTATVGHREAERGLELGHMYSPEEALKIGMVDQLCSAEEVLPTAKNELAKYLAVPNTARGQTKVDLRDPVISNLLKRRDENLRDFFLHIKSDDVQLRMGKYLEMIKSKAESASKK